MQSISPSSQSKQDGHKTGVDFDSFYLRTPYITNTEEFLSEKDTRKALEYWLNNFAVKSRLHSTQDIVHTIQESIAAIDELINEQLNQIIHHDRFQKLEASWRGLKHLVKQATDVKNVKIRILDINWNEVVKDMSRAIEFDQSQLFDKVYSQEYGTPGGEPYGVLLGDYEISHRPSERHPHDDIATLQSISEVAAAAFTPFIASASCELFGLDNFSTLRPPLNLETIFNQKEYIKWRAFRDKADSRFIGLTVPRMIMRLPYRTEPGSYKGVYFYEKSSTPNNENYLWGNACYAFGGILLREFDNVGWFGHIRGVPRNQVGGGLVSELANDYFKTDADMIAHKPFAEIIITDNLERELSDLGFMPFCQCYDAPYASFFSNQSVQKPKSFATVEANVNAKLSAMLQHMLCASRFAHYIKVMIRDKVGSFMNAEDCERFLSEWLFKYSTGREDMEWEEQARYPLRDSSVQVKEHPEKPGQYYCSIYLRPHYQLDQMVSELELVTELTQKT